MYDSPEAISFLCMCVCVQTFIHCLLFFDSYEAISLHFHVLFYYF